MKKTMPGKPNKTRNYRFRFFVIGLLMPLFCGMLSAQTVKEISYPQESLDVRIQKIADGSGFNIALDHKQISGITVRAYSAKNVKWETILYQSLQNTGFEAKKTSVRNFAIVKDTDNTIALNSERKETDTIGEKKIQEVTIVGAASKVSSDKGLLQQQKNTTSLTDGISSEQMKKSSDNNVGQVLKRVAGVTVQDNKFVTVRGMSERYNNMQLNGASLPSTEPNRRNFSFDIVPSGLVDNVTVAKTFTPDMQGEFAGGVVEIKTLAIPRSNFMEFSLGTGFNTESTGKEFKMGKTFNSDYFLGNAKERNWFGNVFNNDQYASYFNMGILKPENAQEAFKMGAAIPNHWGLRNYNSANPIVNYSLSGGHSFNFKDGSKLGFVLAGTYRNEESTETTLEAVHRGTLRYSYFTNDYNFTTSVGAVANIGWENSKHKITFKNLYNNRFSHSAQERLLINDSYNPEFSQYSSPVRNYLLQNRLEGEHKITDKLKVDWFADYNEVARQQYDDRYAKGMIVTKDPEGSYLDGKYLVRWSSMFQAGERGNGESHIMHSDMVENKKNVGANAAYTFEIAENKQKVKAGYWGTFRKGDFIQQYLHPQSYGNVTNLEGLDLNQFLNQDNFANGSLLYYISGSKGDNPDYYRGKQNIHSAYVMGEFQFFNRLRAIGGVRLEDAETTNNYMYYNRITTKIYDTLAVRKQADWLPSATLIYDFTKKLSLRAAYGKTLARPNFRELTQYSYYNIYDRTMYNNLGNLRQTYIDNLDVRFEWYPSPGEIVSVSAFYKKFKDPIETVVSNPSMSGNYESYIVNLEEATTRGFEINIRKNFDFIRQDGWLKDFWFTGNYTWLEGDLSYDYQKAIYDAIGMIPPEGVQTVGERSRPLMGLSPYSLNASLGYYGEIFGGGINYNRNGRRILTAGEGEDEDEYEAPRNALDIQLSAKVWKKQLEFKINATNLLNEDYIVYTNKLNPLSYKGSDAEALADYNANYKGDKNFNNGKDTVRSRVRRGVGFTFSVSYKF